MRVLYSWSLVSSLMSFDHQMVCSLWTAPKDLHIALYHLHKPHFCDGSFQVHKFLDLLQFAVVNDDF